MIQVNSNSLENAFEILKEFKLFDINSFIPQSKQIVQKIEEALTLWFNFLFINKLPAIGYFDIDSNNFSLLFNWIYSDNLGLFIERLFIGNNLNYQKKNLFKSFFLEYQRSLGVLLVKKGGIETYLGLFEKVNLLRIIRICLCLFQQRLVKKIKIKNLYFLTKRVLELTLKKGSYDYINALLTPLKFRTYKTHIIVKIYDTDLLFSR